MRANPLLLSVGKTEVQEVNQVLANSYIQYLGGALLIFEEKYSMLFMLFKLSYLHCQLSTLPNMILRTVLVDNF